MHPIRARNLAELTKQGFRVAPSLPWGQIDEEPHQLRPTTEIAGRLLALDALFAWTAMPESVVASSRLIDYMGRSDLRSHMTPSESAITDLGRDEANSRYVETIGWRLENMWGLAWVLGFEPAPPLGGMIQPEVIDAILKNFIPRPGATIERLVEAAHVRPVDSVVTMEDYFYCAHNAVRSAQLGHPTVPPDFDPVVDGGTVHERRQALTWCLSPGVSWDDTDVST